MAIQLTSKPLIFRINVISFMKILFQVMLFFSVMALQIPSAVAEQVKTVSTVTGQSHTIKLTPREQAWLDKGYTVRVRLGSAMPFHSSSPEPHGIAVDYLKLIGKRHGINLQFVSKPVSWTEALEDLIGTHKWFDLQPTIKRTPERARQIAFTKDYLFAPWVIINRERADFISRIEDLNGKDVAIEKGYLVADLVRSQYPQIKIVGFSNTVEAMQAVAEARVEAYIGNLSIASFVINKNGLENLKVAAPTPFGNHDQAMGIRNDWPELATIIDKALDAMSDAEKQAIHNRWFSLRYEHGLHPWKVLGWIAAITSVFLLILTMSYAWNRRLKQEIALRVETEELLRESEAAALAAKRNLEEAQSVAHVASWNLDIPGNILSWSQETYSIFGLEPGTPLSFDIFCNCIYPEDREMVSSAWKAALEGVPYDIEHRINFRGQIKWVRERASISFDKNGKALGGIGTVQDITESRQAKVALQEANQLLEAAVLKADAASRAKSEFLANMSHEIRTPMNGMLGMAQLLRYTELNQDQQDFVDNMEVAGNNLLALINNILDIAKIESGKIQLEESDFSLAHCIQEVASVQVSLIRQKGLSYTTEIHPEIPLLLRGDALRFKQIMFNLVGNAVKFTQRGGITISARLKSRNRQSVVIWVAVKDTGIGIAAESLSRVFDAFEQADSTTTRNFGGSGLGLSICLRLARLMGGSIWAESVAGAGSTFFVELPFAVSATEQSVDEQVNQQMLTDARCKRLKVLVAEDTPTNALTTVAMLKQMGHSAEVATNGQEALDLYRKGCFDAILMDIQMPVMDGEQAVSIIREQEHKTGGHIPVIAMTAFALIGDKERFLSTGFDGYIPKPVDMKLLLAELQRLS